MLVFSEEERLEYRLRGMTIWREHAEKYRVGVIKYRFLVHEREKLTPAKRPNIIPESVIKNYPEVPFLRFLSEEQVREFLTEADDRLLYRTIEQIEDATHYNLSYRTVMAKVMDLEAVLLREQKSRRAKNDRSHPLGYDPDYKSYFGSVYSHRHLSSEG